MHFFMDGRWLGWVKVDQCNFSKIEANGAAPSERETRIVLWSLYPFLVLTYLVPKLAHYIGMKFNSYSLRTFKTIYPIVSILAYKISFWAELLGPTVGPSIHRWG